MHGMTHHALLGRFVETVALVTKSIVWLLQLHAEKTGMAREGILQHWHSVLSAQLYGTLLGEDF